MRGFLLVAVISLFFVISANSTEIPNLTGSWDQVSFQQYSDETGYLNMTSDGGSFFITNQDDRAFTGYTTYAGTEDGVLINETVSGIISSDGKNYWRDHEDSGISFGEILSDHEIIDIMLIPGEPSMVIRQHMVKEGTAPSAEITDPINITGVWNYTHQRRTEEMTGFGTFDFTEQKGRLFNGSLQVPEEDGSVLDLQVSGIIGINKNLYALADNQAIYVGMIPTKKEMHYIVVHPGDEDETFVVDRWMTRYGEEINNSALQYPDIDGAWNITARTTIQNGTITHTGEKDSEWMIYAKSFGPFFTGTRYSDDPATPPVLDVYGVFNGEKEAFMASGAPTYVIYHFPDKDTIDAIIMRREGGSMMYLDTLKRSE